MTKEDLRQLADQAARTAPITKVAKGKRGVTERDMYLLVDGDDTERALLQQCTTRDDLPGLAKVIDNRGRTFVNSERLGAR